jgi:carbonic anhydrase/acetyltransferase-like protein (isoleucine patch superfamily)
MGFEQENFKRWRNYPSTPEYRGGIHRTARVSGKVGRGCKVGPYAIVDGNLGNNVKVGAYSVVSLLANIPDGTTNGVGETDYD